MPGRGQPWKGVGKGNPDRIGTLAIADGSITEADLDSSVTAKLNSGGGYDPLVNDRVLEEMNWNSFTGAFLEKYSVTGTNVNIQPQANGAPGLNSGNTVQGSRAEISTTGSFDVNPQKSGNVM